MEGPIKMFLGDPSGIRTEHKYRWYLMRGIGRFHRLRDWGRFISDPPTNGARPDSGQASYFDHVSRDDVLGDLRRDGLARGFDLPRPAVEEILAFADATPFWANRDPSLPMMRPGERADIERESGKRAYLGEYRSPWDCPTVKRIGQDPVVVDVARGYLGVLPRLIATELWWSFPAGHGQEEQSAAAQLFHFDLDDFRSIKLFFYLTDVDEAAGPHVFVRTTHASRRLAHELLIRRLNDEEVTRAYGGDLIERICLPAGSGFFEDNYGLHKGESPTGRERLLLAYTYAVNDFYHF